LFFSFYRRIYSYYCKVSLQYFYSSCNYSVRNPSAVLYLVFPKIKMLSATLSTKKPIQNILGSKPGLQVEKSATNRLNRGMAFVSSSELFYRQLYLDIQERLLFKITYEHQYHSNIVFLPLIFSISL